MFFLISLMLSYWVLFFFVSYLATSLLGSIAPLLYSLMASSSLKNIFRLAFWFILSYFFNVSLSQFLSSSISEFVSIKFLAVRLFTKRSWVSCPMTSSEPPYPWIFLYRPYNIYVCSDFWIIFLSFFLLLFCDSVISGCWSLITS